MNKKEVIYNILLPIWILVFWPSWLWLFLIPANYLIDRLVLRWSLGEMPDKGAFCRKHTWKICIAGFFSDLCGAGSQIGSENGGDHCAVSVFFSVKAVVLRMVKENGAKQADRYNSKGEYIDGSGIITVTFDIKRMWSPAGDGG